MPHQGQRHDPDQNIHKDVDTADAVIEQQPVDRTVAPEEILPHGNRGAGEDDKTDGGDRKSDAAKDHIEIYRPEDEMARKRIVEQEQGYFDESGCDIVQCVDRNNKLPVFNAYQLI